jgi:hypothetical protein
MAINVTVAGNTPREVAISGAVSKTVAVGGRATSASAQSWDKSLTHLTQTTVQDALAELATRFYQRTVTPSVGVNEGDLWYDLTAQKLKLYSGIQWDAVGLSNTENLDGDYFRFTSDSVVSSGNLAEFKNDTTTTFSIRYDGVLTLKDQASAPSVVANGLYSDGANLYFGKE